jgi:acetolactate synthase-1/2/3 large subunit
VPEILPNYTLQNDCINEEYTIPTEFLSLWANSKRPIVLAGNGIHLSKTKNEFHTFLRRFTVPYVVSFFGSDLGDNYIGKVGIVGNRAGNFAIQNADLILCLGCRLSKGITGYNRELFAREAKILYVDIDKSEFLKQKGVDVHVNMDLKTFFRVELPLTNISQKWISKTLEWKILWANELPEKEGTLICPYRHLNAFFKHKKQNSIVTASSGSIYNIIWHMYQYKYGDRFITSSHGDMGYEMTTAIGASMHDKRTFPILGDGSFQFNVQELQTIKHHNLPITILVFNNDGYGAIKVTQNNVFKREFGTSSKSDISFCNIRKVAKAYDIPYYKVKHDRDVSYLQHTDGPLLVEIECNVQGRFPRVSNKPMEDGTFKNMPHEEMAPFLDDTVLKKHLFIKRI